MFTRFLMGAIIFFLFDCQVEDSGSVIPVELSSFNVALGNPSKAVTNINQPDNYLIELPQYTLSYNRSRGTAN